MKEKNLKLRLLLFSALFVMAYATLSIAQTPSRSGGGISVGPPVNGKVMPRIESKPDAEWPKLDAREACTIVLRAVFRSNGKVTDITFIDTKPKKPKGYSEKDIKILAKRSIEAARKIRFVPSMKDGRPVSMWMELEYNFSPELLKREPIRDE